MTHLSATNVKNIHYPKKDTLNCQTETLCLNLGTKLPWTLCPWEVKVRNRLVTFNTSTVIDTTTNLVKTTRVDNKKCAHVTNKLRQCWISRYPPPQRIVHDDGGKFTGHEFKHMCRAFGGLKAPQSTAKNQYRMQFVKECTKQ